MLRLLKGQSQMLFVLLTSLDEVCGGFLDQPIQYDTGKYCGTGECFLFSWNATESIDDTRDTMFDEDLEDHTDLNIVGKFKVFPSTGINQYYFYCDETGFNFGSE